MDNSNSYFVRSRDHSLGSSIKNRLAIQFTEKRFKKNKIVILSNINRSLYPARVSTELSIAASKYYRP